MKDLAIKYDISGATVNYHIKKLKDSGLIQMDIMKTKLSRSATISSSKVYVPTKKVLEIEEKLGPVGENLERLRATPSSPNDLNIDNFHASNDFVIKYKVKNSPEIDSLPWDREISLDNGVTQKIKRMDGEIGRLTVECTGKYNPTITVKPHIYGTTSEEIEEHLKQVTWGMYRYIKNHGYDLSLPEIKGEGKYTVISDKDLPEGYLEGPNWTKDQSQGRDEIHGKTGSRRGNKIFTNLLTQAGYLAQATDKIERLEQKIDTQGELITRLVDILTKISDRSKNMTENIELPEPGDNIYR